MSVCPVQPPQQAWSLWSPWQDDYLRWRVLWSLAQAGITCVLALVLGLAAGLGAGAL